MPKIKCPKCSSEISFDKLPADRKVSCGACAGTFVIKAPQSPKPAAQPATSDDPFGLPGPDLGGLDLGNMPLGDPLGGLPTAGLPTAGLPGGVSPGPGAAPWAGGGGYAPPAGGKASGSKASKKAKKSATGKSGGKSKKTLLIAVIGAVVLLAGGIVTTVILLANKGSTATASADRPRIYLPPNWEPIKLKGVYGILPKGEGDGTFPGNFNGKMVRSPDTNSLFLFGVMDAIAGEVNEEKVGKATRSLLGGDILPSGSINVGGFPGFRGTYSVGLFLPDRCMIEMIPLEDRFIVRGYMAWSSEVSNQGGDATEAGKIDSKKEQEEFKHFSEALYVGPKPGFFSN